jgi:hypothetical protein
LDQTGWLNTSRLASGLASLAALPAFTTASITQSALTPVRSVECGLFA